MWEEQFRPGDFKLAIKDKENNYAAAEGHKNSISEIILFPFAFSCCGDTDGNR